MINFVKYTVYTWNESQWKPHNENEKQKGFLFDDDIKTEHSL